jgi:glycosyltransferase involved in cell wall biosynthesis
MTEDIYFSIIIPTANRAFDLEETLNRINESTFKKFEVIIIDNNSVDNTKEIIKKFDFINYVKNNKNKYVVEARNQAIFLAKGKVIFSMDDDSFPEKDTLQTAYEIFENNSDIGLLTCGIKNYNTHINKNEIISKNIILENALTWSGCGGFFLKSLFDKYGPWDEDPPRMGHYENMTMIWTLNEEKRIVSSANIFVYHKVSNAGDGGIFRYENATIIDEVYAQYYFIIKYFNIADTFKRLYEINSILTLSTIENKSFIFFKAFALVIKNLKKIIKSRNPYPKKITDLIRTTNCFRGK